MSILVINSGSSSIKASLFEEHSMQSLLQIKIVGIRGKDVLKRKPRRPKESVFNRLMLERTLVASLVMGVFAFLSFKYLLSSGWSEDSARNVILLLLVLFENFHLLNSRSETQSVFAISLLKSPILIGGGIAAFSIHLTMMYLPFGQSLLGTEAVSLNVWLILIAVASSILVVMELHKILWRKRIQKYHD